jgi:tetratricopeptide (TPR) repeat protein
LEFLDGLPLAIAQAASFLQETGIELQKYIEFYEQKWQELMKSRDWGAAPLHDYPDRSVWTTWAISFGAIQEMNVAAANLLLLWAFLDSKDLWYGLFTAACSASATTATSLSEWIGEIGSNELEFTKAIGLLRNYSLIEDVQGLGSYTTHPVVHRWAYYFQGEDSQLQLAQLAVIVVGWAVPHISSRDYSTLQRRLLPHAQACSRWVAMNGTRQWPTQESGSIKIKLAEERVVILDAVMLLGNLYKNQGKLGEAKKMYERALEGYEKVLGPEYTSTLDTINNLGILYADQGKLGEAEKMYERALKGYEKVFGPEYTSMLDTVNNLGILYMNQGKLGEAEKMFERALEGKMKIFGPEHILTLDTINNLGNLYKNQGKLGEAEKIYKQALEGKMRALGPEHTSTLNTINNLGSLYADQDKLGEAEKMFEQALKGYEKVLGPEHTSTLDTVNNLGSLYANQDKLGEAEKMFEQALEGKMKVLGPEHTSTLNTISNLGNLYADQGKFSEAEKMYKQALEGYKKALGANFETYIPALNTIWGLASLFEYQAELVKARTMYSKVLNGYAKAVGPDHPRSRDLRDKLHALDAVTDNNASVEVRIPVNIIQEEASGSSVRGRPSRSKRHRLLDKLGLR